MLNLGMKKPFDEKETKGDGVFFVFREPDFEKSSGYIDI